MTAIPNEDIFPYQPPSGFTFGFCEERLRKLVDRMHTHFINMFELEDDKLDPLDLIIQSSILKHTGVVSNNSLGEMKLNFYSAIESINATLDFLTYGEYFLSYTMGEDDTDRINGIGLFWRNFSINPIPTKLLYHRSFDSNAVPTEVCSNLNQ